MAYIKSTDKNQASFLPPSIDEYVGEESMVRIIDAFVEGLDLLGLGFGKSHPAQTGRPAYDPKILLKLYLYGYVNRIRSSRRLAKECTRNIEVMFLLGALTPDFRTIADFRKDNTAPIKAVFSEFCKICAKLKLLSSGTVAIDGTKIRAQNARANAFNAESLEKKLARIDERIARYLKALDESDDDDDDDDDDGIDPDAVSAMLEELKGRKDTYEGYLKRIKEEGITQILTTDPEAHRMHTKDGFNCCYNAQTAVDSTSHIITAFDISSSPTDQHHLKSTADIARGNLGLESLEVVADKGYDSSSDIKDCLLGGIIPHVAMKYDKGVRIINLEHKPVVVTKSLLKSKNPEDISACLHAGVLPDCYKGKGIDIEIQYRDTLSCFTKEENGIVICPQGKTLTLVKTRKNNPSPEIYKSHKACRLCQNRCTDSTNAKEVAFSLESDCVPTIVYGSQKNPPRAIPDSARISPNNHALYKKNHAPSKVIVRIFNDKEKLKMRMSTVEHPFGTIKWYDGAHYFLMRGKQKVSAELALSFLAYNLRRALNAVGFKQLMAQLG
jgi:transposase